MIQQINDLQFLKKLNEQKNKIIYAKIILLTFEESPIQEISGIITEGSINIDGKSAVRRTCSLTLNSIPTNIKSSDWEVKSKFQLFLGVSNQVDKNFDDIIWFNEGIYVINTFSINKATNNFSITISGKDKMCLLNGECGGNIPADHDFGVIDIYDRVQDKTITQDLLIYDIIKESVHLYGKELYHNILINDLDTVGYELLEYKGNKSIYLKKKYKNNTDDGQYCGITKNTKTIVYKQTKNSINIPTKISEIKTYENLNPSINFEEQSPDKFTLKPITTTSFDENTQEYYTFVKINPKDVVGYRETGLTYPNALSLSLKAGETITTLLDKIVKTFGDYEYFYDTDGHFVFQKKKTYITNFFNGLQTDDVTGEEYIKDFSSANKIAYNFDNSNLISAYQNTPNITNLKNDFVCWGQKTGESGTEMPIHARCSIDSKPTYYRAITVTQDDIKNLPDIKHYQVPLSWLTLDGLTAQQKAETQKNSRSYWEFYTKDFDTNDLVDPATAKLVDWREVIYQMALDYYQYGTVDYFNEKIIEANQNNNLYLNGYTGYEQYYLDIFSFWRELYNWEEDKQTVYYEEVKNLTKKIAVEKKKELCVANNFQKLTNIQELEEITDYTTLYVIRDNSLVPLKNCIKLDCDKKNKVKNNFYYIIKNEKEYSKTNDLTNINDKRKIYIQLNRNTYINILDYVCKYSSTQDTFMIYSDWKHSPSDLSTLIEKGYIYKLNSNGGYIKLHDLERDEPFLYKIYYNKITDSFNEKIKIYNYTLNGQDIKITNGKMSYTEKLITYYLPYTNYYSLYDSDVYNFAEKRYWNKNVYENPARLNFWFDMLDTSGELNGFSVSNIGDRPKVDNDTKIKSIYYKDIPNIVYYGKKEIKTLNHSSGYDYVLLPNSLKEQFVISGQNVSLLEAINSNINNYAQQNFEINLTTLPIYHLNPNTRINVIDKDTGINGDYIINKLTIPLVYNGTMTIGASKAIDYLV